MTTRPHAILALIVTLVLFTAPGCGVLGGGGPARLATRGGGGAVFTADLPTRVYTSTDRNSADFYLTDLPAAVWMGGADVSTIDGVMIHVHMFLAPKAGRTPISADASTCVIRVLVLSNGELGVYGGGGFLAHAGGAGGQTFGGSVARASVRLTRATPGFEDPLGPASFAGTVAATRDEKQATLMGRAFGAIVAYTEPVTPAPIVAAGPAAPAR
jgi:hypothetical protein